tara:strand:- start:106 stop:351 length:246 start_codon:yes stop_codon:yes gene_type:complete
MNVNYPQYKVNTDSYDDMLEFLGNYPDYRLDFVVNCQDEEDEDIVLEEFIIHLDKRYPNRFILFRLDENDKYLYIVDKHQD